MRNSPLPETKAHDIPVFDMGAMSLANINEQIQKLIQKYGETK